MRATLKTPGSTSIARLPPVRTVNPPAPEALKRRDAPNAARIRREREKRLANAGVRVTPFHLGGIG